MGDIGNRRFFVIFLKLSTCKKFFICFESCRKNLFGYFLYWWDSKLSFPFIFGIFRFVNVELLAV
jgi:hypothetical protein